MVTGTVASTDGLDIAYTVVGSGTPALVLVHGWMCDRTYWDHQVADLSTRWKVVALDLGGHGDSGLEREGWPLARYVDDVVAVIDHLALDEVILVGHSMGGPVSLGVAAAKPEVVRAVIGIDTLQNADLKYEPEQWQPVLAGFDTAFEATCRSFVGSMFPPEADVGVQAQVADDMCTGPEDVGRALMHQFPEYDLPAAMTAVSDVKVHCINSAMFPTAVDVNRAYVPGFEVTVMDGVGHFPMLEDPTGFTTELARIVSEIVSDPPSTTEG
jgi:pimeloyl-ACP methyl ester carboxylesterase